MNTGIQDAYNLAWKLALTIRGELNHSVLASYEAERHENAEHLLKTTDKMFDIMAGVNRFWNFVRLHIIPHVARFVSKNAVLNKRIFPLLSQIGIAYPNSPLTIKSSLGRVNAGSLMPYFELPGGVNIFDLLTSPAFKILFFGNPGNNRIIEVEYASGIIRHSFPDIPKKLFGAATDFYILLRPDNHISYIGKDANGCRIFLDKITSKNYISS